MEVGLLHLHSFVVKGKPLLRRHRGLQLHFSAAGSIAAATVELVAELSAVVGSASLERLAHLDHNPKVVRAGRAIMQHSMLLL